jgi:phenylpyruvate tautomerase PptA (4-oxalocrotonate tautomerase family)
MPYVTLTTNAQLTSADQAAFAQACVAAIAGHAGKPESSVMVAFTSGAPMVFRAETETPTAFLEIKYIGDFAPDAKAAIVTDICAALNERAGVPGERVYLKFTGTPGDQWGCDGRMFG